MVFFVFLENEKYVILYISIELLKHPKIKKPLQEIL